MIKLVLTSFKFKTGENTYEDQSLVVVNSQGDDVEDRTNATMALAEWFPSRYHESELLYVIGKPTIIAHNQTSKENLERSQILSTLNRVRDLFTESCPEKTLPETVDLLMVIQKVKDLPEHLFAVDQINKI